MWGYSMLEQDDFLALAGVEDLAAGQRMLRRTKPSKTPDEVLVAAAVAVGLPSTFATEGADAIAKDEPGLSERIEALERKMESVLRQTGADVRREPPGALGQDARGLSPNPPHLERSDSAQEGESQQGSGEA